MERKGVILTVILGTVGVLGVLVGLGLGVWLYLRSRKSKQNCDLEDQGSGCGSSMQQQSCKKRNGFLSLKTPLIGTKMLG